ncbi:NAD(P)/FAD-dependent oxidoreductase [bacterium]|nr:NAD(P)/FAD-dependent oxidoreductase [bacterium]
MEYHDVIIAGGGPAGSSCARKLRQAQVDCIVLDKAAFPRTKLCAGWITPEVVSDLDIDVTSYPHRILAFPAMHAYLFGIRIKIPTLQYSIRRYEFDHWLLERCGAPSVQHEIKNIRLENGHYVIDDRYACKYLVGAGGTNCPVFRMFFQGVNPRSKKALIVCRELEFPYEVRDDRCLLWFFENNLPGYSWFVPKANGYVNVGIGGFEEKLKRANCSINDHWNFLIAKLKKQNLISDEPLTPKGHSYFLREPVKNVQIGNAFLIGDAAGLATRDMGEGIGPAVRSGMLAAESIITGKPYSVDSVGAYSIRHPIFNPLIRWFTK